MARARRFNVARTRHRPQHLVIITDSADIYDQLNLLLTGGTPLGRHKYLWDTVLPCRDKVRGAILIKARVEAEEAMQRTEAGGCPYWHHDLKAGGRYSFHGLWRVGPPPVGDQQSISPYPWAS